MISHDLLQCLLNQNVAANADQKPFHKHFVRRAVNVPTALLRALTQLRDSEPTDSSAAQPLLIHISTDQVYSGKERLSAERTCPAPVNVYGETKLAAERAVQAAWPRHVILRSSIIYGPQTSQPVSRALFVQFVVRSWSAALSCIRDVV